VCSSDLNEIARELRPPADAPDCATTLKRLRQERELARVRGEIRRLQEAGPTANDAEITLLLGRQSDLLKALDVAEAPGRRRVIH